MCLFKLLFSSVTDKEKQKSKNRNTHFPYSGRNRKAPVCLVMYLINERIHKYLFPIKNKSAEDILNKKRKKNYKLFFFFFKTKSN